MKEFKLLSLSYIFIIFLFHFKYSYNQSYNYSYLTFNLQSYVNNSNNFDDAKNFIYSYLNSFYYTEINFGSPEQKYIMQVSLDDYEFQLTNYNCDIQTKDKSTEKLFDPYLSTSSEVEISGVNFTYYGANEVFRITDHIKLLSNNSNNYIYPKIIFIYNPRNSTYAKKRIDYSPYTCFKLGLRLPDKDLDLYGDYELSLLGQFKRKKIINSYEWFIEYDSNNEVKLIMGISPFNYNSKKYNEDKKRTIKGDYRPNNDYYYWNLEFTKIYLTNKENKRQFLENRMASFLPSLNVIKGTYEFQKSINETIFSKLIDEHKCFEEYEGVNGVIYCENTIEIKNYIKERFITLKFFQVNIEEEFILTYDDLFIEKGNKIFFLVVFDYQNSLITWILGKPFLKKYFFSFNYDSKVMNYYNINQNNDKEEENSNNNHNNNWILIIIVLVLIIIFCIIGFLLARHLYRLKSNKKATELDEDYQYQEGNNQINNGEGLIN